MFDLTSSKLLLLGIIALLVVGPKDLPALLRTVGRYMGMIKRQAAEFRAQIDEAMRESELADLKKQVEDFGKEAQSAVSQAESEFQKEASAIEAETARTLEALDAQAQEQSAALAGEPAPPAAAPLPEPPPAAAIAETSGQPAAAPAPAPVERAGV